jgi:anti-sigma factor RsiW
MNDCSNAEMRDRLPDLLHDRLSAGAQAEVTAHLTGCIDCREELELLRDLQVALAVRTPRVDVAYVVNALPKPPARTATPIAPRRRTWSDWRVAAAVTLLVAGGSSVVLVNRDPSPSSGATTVNVVPVPGTQTFADTPRAQTAPTTSAVASAEGLGMGGHLVDLDDDQLQELIDDISQMKAVPNVEPEPVTIRIDPNGSLDMEIM